MSRKSIVDFAEATSLANNDIFLIVRDPSGLAVTNKITVNAFVSAIGSIGFSNTQFVTFSSESATIGDVGANTFIGNTAGFINLSSNSAVFNSATINNLTTNNIAFATLSTNNVTANTGSITTFTSNLVNATNLTNNTATITLLTTNSVISNVGSVKTMTVGAMSSNNITSNSGSVTIFDSHSAVITNFTSNVASISVLGAGNATLVNLSGTVLNGGTLNSNNVNSNAATIVLLSSNSILANSAVVQNLNSNSISSNTGFITNLTSNVTTITIMNAITANAINLSGNVVTGGTVNSNNLNSNSGSIQTLSSNSITANSLALSNLALISLATALTNIYVGNISVANLPNNAIYQRTTTTGSLANLGSGPVTFTISNDLPITKLEYRLRNYANTADVLVNWTIASPPLAAGNNDVTISVPSGKYRYLTDFRPNNYDAKIVSTNTGIMVGEVLAFAGQSLAQQFIDNRPGTSDANTFSNVGLTVNPWAWIWAATALNTGAIPQVPDTSAINYPVTSWSQSSNTGNWKASFAVQLQNQLIATANVPVGLVGYAVGGTGIDSWLPGYTGPGTPKYDILTEVIDGAGGRFGSFLWCQGHYETRNGSNGSVYFTKLGQLFSAISNSYPGVSYKKYISSVPAIGSYSPATPSTINDIRTGAKNYVANNASNSYYIDGLDIELKADQVHYTQPGGVTFANDWYRSIANGLNLAAYTAKGPTITSANRLFGNTEIVLTINQTNNGTALVANGDIANQFVIYPANTITGNLAISNVTITNSTSISIQLANTPTEPAALDVWYRRTPDTANIIATSIRDNVLTGNITYGRQLWTSGNAVTSSVPVLTLTINNLSDNTAGSNTTVSGTYNNGLPTSFEYSLNSGISWTAAPTPTIGSGLYSFNLPSGFPVGVYKLKVRDPVSLGSNTSNMFNITQSSPPVIPSIANNIFSFDMAVPYNNVFTDTSLINQAISGEYIGSIRDSSGANNSFIQANQTQKPLFMTNVKNALPGLLFNGSLSQFLTYNNLGTLKQRLQNSTGYTMFLVFTNNTLPTVAYTIIAASDKAKLGGFSIIRGAQGLSTSVLRASRNSNTVTYQPSVASGTGSNFLSKVITRYDSTANTLAIKVNSLVEATVSTLPGLDANPFDTLYIGAEGSNNLDQFFFDGYIHEIQIWDVTANSSIRDSLVTYATTKWGT